MELLLFPTILLALTHGLTTAKTLAPNPDKITNGTRRIVLEGDEEVSFIAVGDWGSRHHQQTDVAQVSCDWWRPGHHPPITGHGRVVRAVRVRLHHVHRGQHLRRRGDQ